MKIKTIVPLVFVLFLAAAGYSQDNSCAYTFTYPNAPVSFSFCVTVWGTLASIQSPIGVNHLDPVNPVEGWTGSILDNGGGGDGFSVVPGLGIVGFRLPVVREPYGPGTLPLIFDYDGDGFYVERIDALPNQRGIVMALTIHSCYGDCTWFGTMSKVANIRPDGNSTGNFAHSSFAAFGYVKHGVMLSVDETPQSVLPCAGTDPNGASATPYDNCSISNTPFTGPGAVFAYWSFYSPGGKPMRMKATYRVF
jgi:hypothetical protein